MTNSIKLPTIKHGKQSIILLSILICFTYFLTQSKSSAVTQGYVADVSIHKSDSPISLNAANDAFNWQPIKEGNFNLGNHRYSLIRIQLDQSVLPSPDGLVLVIARNNIFTDAILLYQHDNVTQEKLLTPSSTDNKLLSIKLTKETIKNPVYISISGRYLRGELFVLTPKEFTDRIKKSSLIDGIYFGIISLFLLFSILSYVFFRQTIFLKYGALLTSIFLWVAAGEGWLKSTFPQIQGVPFFTPNSLGILFFITFAFFSYDYLKLKQKKTKAGSLLKYNQRMLIFIWLCYCVSFERTDPTMYQIAYGLALLNCLIVLAITFIIAVRTLSSKGKQGVFYLCALIVFVIGSVISGLSVANIIDYFVGWTLIKVSSFIEVLILASGLMYGYKVALTSQEDKDKQHSIVQANIISTQKELAESSTIIENNKNSRSLCPQIAKIVALLDKVLYVKAAGNYSEIVYRHGTTTKEQLVDTNLQTIEKALGSEKIIRCHKSYLVKVDTHFILKRRTSADYDLIVEEHLIPIGRKYLKDIRRL
ncbi:7TM diverse intracellular signaling domain-containing protein [Pseudoalteromonas tunicata]|uniref:7TM diverse intracellular signaling domain-containing protein n=1 Tax=Pseudoalteromonas tunicata TaxID=314281 RepID=UPI000304AD29|nr:7TM diverse intracellular signaling domain-containing protein [Pseudoalteromonas tunicata]ATC94165.1 hypothetical protein PTUN_a1552 [Pseudoalteromonas tunicata]